MKNRGKRWYGRAKKVNNRVSLHVIYLAKGELRKEEMGKRKWERKKKEERGKENGKGKVVRTTNKRSWR